MSTYNSKMTKVSGATIKLMTSAGKNMSLTAATGDSTSLERAGVIASNLYVGFRQPSTAKTAAPYQIQFRRRYKYTAANRKKRNATYTSTWANCPWMNAIKMTGFAFGSKENPNTWNKANRSVSTSTAYRTILNLKGTKIASGYTAVQYQFRIRKYNKSKNQHGPWSYSSVMTISRRPVLFEYRAQRSVDGGLHLDCLLDTGGQSYKFHVTSIKDSSGRQLLKGGEVSGTFKNVKIRSFVRQSFIVPAKHLTRTLKLNESLKLTAYVLTEMNTRTYWNNKQNAAIRVWHLDNALNKPNMTITCDRAKGIVKVSLWLSDPYDNVTKYDVSAKYSGKSYQKSVIASWKELPCGLPTRLEPARYYFLLPLNKKVGFTGSIANYEGDNGYQHKDVSKAVKVDTGEVFYVNSKTTMDRYASVYGNIAMTSSITSAATLRKMQGRSLPFATFGSGTENKITLTGTLFEDSSATPSYIKADGMTRDKWENLARKREPYVLRTPEGDVIDVVITDLTIRQSGASTSELSVEFAEVSQ